MQRHSSESVRSTSARDGQQNIHQRDRQCPLPQVWCFLRPLLPPLPYQNIFTCAETPVFSSLPPLNLLPPLSKYLSIRRNPFLFLPLSLEPTVQAIAVAHGLLRDALLQVAGELEAEGRLDHHVPGGRGHEPLQRCRPEPLAAGAKHVHAGALFAAREGRRARAGDSCFVLHAAFGVGPPVQY